MPRRIWRIRHIRHIRLGGYGGYGESGPLSRAREVWAEGGMAGNKSVQLHVFAVYGYGRRLRVWSVLGQCMEYLEAANWWTVSGRGSGRTVRLGPCRLARAQMGSRE